MSSDEDTVTITGIDATFGEIKQWNPRQLALFHMQRDPWSEGAPQSVVDAKNAYRQACVDWFREGGLV